MATVNEQIVTGRKFRKLVDEATKLWQRISFWTRASDVEFNDGSTAETKMGAINGITDSLVSTSSNIAASAKSVNQLNNKLANGRVDLVVTNDGLGYKLDGADTVLPFIKSISFTAHWRTQLVKNGADFDHNTGTLRLKVTKNSVTIISGAWPHMGDTYINGTMNTRVWIEKYSNFVIE